MYLGGGGVTRPGDFEGRGVSGPAAHGLWLRRRAVFCGQQLGKRLLGSVHIVDTF